MFFSGTVAKSQLEKVAASDDMAVVSKVEEVFWDFEVIEESLFVASDITSLLLLLKAKPVIRYEANSSGCLKAANSAFFEMTNASSLTYPLFKDMRADKPLLVFLDRKNDPLTPLLAPWTYQLMVHEYLGIRGNMVKVGEEQYTLGSSDKFFAETMFLNFADLSEKVQALLASFGNKKNSLLTSLEDMKLFILEYPEYKKLAHNVNKHISITAELSKKVLGENLWEVSLIEQLMSLGSETDFSSHTEDLENIKKIITENSLKGEPKQVLLHFKIRLVILYALRYEKCRQKAVERLKMLLKDQGADEEDILLIDFFVRFCGSKQRLSNKEEGSQLGFSGTGNSNLSIFTPLKDNNLIASLKKLGGAHKKAKSFEDESFDYEEELNTSLYMQHRPRLLYVIHDILCKKLSQEAYPILSPYDENVKNSQFKEIILYFVGGVTYEEARVVGLLNEKYADLGLKLIVGSDRLINSLQYMADMGAERLKDDGNSMGMGTTTNGGLRSLDDLL